MSRLYYPNYPKNHTGPSWIVTFQGKRSRKVWIKRAIKALTLYGLGKFDTIAFRGMSGALIGPALCDALGKNMILVRKKEKSGHSYNSQDVHGYTAARKYIIVDDFVDSGNTAKIIVRSIRKHVPDATCLGVLEVQNIVPKDLKGKALYLTQIEDEKRKKVLDKCASSVVS